MEAEAEKSEASVSLDSQYDPHLQTVQAEQARHALGPQTGASVGLGKDLLDPTPSITRPKHKLKARPGGSLRKMRFKSKKKGEKSLYEYNPEDIDILMNKLDAKR